MMNEGETVLDINKDDLENRLKFLESMVELSPEDERNMTEMLAYLKSVVLRKYPSVEVKPFGSSACDLGFHGSDLDICIEFGQRLFGKKEKDIKSMELAKLLRHHERFRGAKAIVDARTPIVQLQDMKTGIKCDISPCSVSMGRLNTKYIKFCVTFDPRVRSLIMIVKCFAKRHHISGSGLGDHFNSYSIVLLVIAFLQSQEILHPLGVLQAVPGLTEVLVNDHNFSFCSNTSSLPPLRPNTLNTAQLLQGFFNYYGHFDFHSNAVSLLSGKTVSKESLFLQQNLLVVQDPFELSRNVTAAVSSRRLLHLVSSCQAASTLLRLMLTEAREEELGLMFGLLFQPRFLEYSALYEPGLLQLGDTGHGRETVIMKPSGRPG